MNDQLSLSPLEHDVLRLLKENARQSDSDIADKLNASESDVSQAIQHLVDQHVIKQFTTVVNDAKLTDNHSPVRALIEVKINPEKTTGFETIAKRIYQYPMVIDHFLISGSYDFLVVVEGSSIQDIGNFVFDKLAPIGSITSTATHFILKKYKENGIAFFSQPIDNRITVSP